MIWNVVTRPDISFMPYISCCCKKLVLCLIRNQIGFVEKKQKSKKPNISWTFYFLNTVCFSTCDTFDQPVRTTKFHQLLVIYDSFCSWMATNLIHNCNFDHNSEGWQWEPLHLRCQNSTILTFYPDLANLRHLNSDFFSNQALLSHQ